MRAVLLRVRATLSGRRLATLVLALVVALTVGIVLGVVAGARRTASTPDRYTRAVGGDADTVLTQPSGAPQTAAVRALPEIASLHALTYLTAVDDQHTNAAMFAGDGYLDERLSAGRLPTGMTEAVASPSFLSAGHHRLGDTVTLSFYTPEQLAAQTVYQVPPAGANLDVTLVGVVSSASSLDDPTPILMVPPELLDHESVGVVGTVMTIHLAPGATLDQLRASMASVPGHEQMFFQSGQVVSESTRSAVRAQATGLWIVAAVAGLAVLAALGQMLVRYIRSTADDSGRLSALGYTAHQATGEDVLRAGVVLAIGVPLGVVLAIAASPFFPTGFVRGLEIAPDHLHVDVAALGLGALAFALLLLGWVAVGSLAARRAPAAERPSPVAEAVARSGLAPSTATGVRFALLRQGRSRVSTRATVVTLCLAVAAVTGTLVFAASLRQLVSDPTRYGYDFDATAGSETQGEVSDAAIAAATTDPSLDAAALLLTASATVGRTDLAVVGVDPIRGGLVPKVLSGRFPASADEVALGQISADALGVSAGDELTFTTDSGQSVTYHVVGITVVPSVSFGDGAGHGATMLRSGFDRLGSDPNGELLALRKAPGATLPATLGDAPVGSIFGLSKPADVINVDRARSVPVVLAGLIGVLATITLVHSLVVSVRWRRRDLAILRSLGADRSWVGRAVHAQATTLALIAAVVGIPLGVVGGRLTFAAVAGGLGLVSDAATPLLLVTGTVLAILVIANLAAAVPARSARRTAVATLLHSE